MKISKKIHFTSIFSMCVLGIMLWYSVVNMKENLLEERYDRAKDSIEIAIATVNYFHTLQLENKLTESEAQKSALTELSKMTFGKDGYFFTFKQQGDQIILLEHPFRKDKINKDISKLNDINGNSIYVNFVNLIKKQGKGFSTYHTIKPTKSDKDSKSDKHSKSDAKSNIHKKTSYISSFKPWDWGIGSGIYIDDIDDAIWEDSRWLVLIFIILTSVAFAFNTFLSNSIRKPLSHCINTINHIIVGNINVTLHETKRLDEIGELNRAMFKMLDNSINLIRMKNGLDHILTPLMIVDTSGVILFKNSSAEEMISMIVDTMNVESKNVVSLADFGSYTLATFLKDSNYSSEMVILGNFTFKLSKSPVLDDASVIAEFVIEWTDITDEYAVQEALENLIHQASLGDLSVRIENVTQRGFLKSISDSLNTFMDVLESSVTMIGEALFRLAIGDLNYQVETAHGGKFSDILLSIQESYKNLSNIVDKIQEITEQIDTTVLDLSLDGQKISKHADDQSVSLSETSSTMNELSTQLSHSASNIKNLELLAVDSLVQAKSGLERSEYAVQSVENIRTYSEEVITIIDLLEEIYFQTNLLAFNATIEASHAGEAGQGFAVIAEEIRSLAQLSAKSSEQIKSILGKNKVQMDDGVNAVRQTGSSLSAIVDSFYKVESITQKITNSIVDQSVGVQQVNMTISTIDDSTKKNAVMASNSRNKIEMLALKSSELKDSVSFFKQ
jgi:methyl-accepting chemotaxis protein